MMLEDKKHLSDELKHPIGAQKKTLKEILKNYSEEQLLNYIRKNYKKEDIWNE